MSNRNIPLSHSNISGNWADDALKLASGLNGIIPFNSIGVGTRAKVVAEEERKTEQAATMNKIYIYSAIGVIFTIVALILISKFKN